MKLQRVLAAFVVALAVGAGAAESPKVSLQAEQTPVKDVMAEISKQVGLQIFCESDVQGAVSGSFAAMELEKFFDTVTAGGKLSWQKLYLPVTPEKKPTLEDIKARIKAIKAIGERSIVVYDPKTKVQTAYVIGPVESSKIIPESLGMQTFYLISAVKTQAPATKLADASAPGQVEPIDPKVVEQFQSMQMERIGMLNALKPEQRAKLLQQEMVSEMSLDPTTRAAVMKAQFDARRSMTPEMQQQYRDSMREVMQSVRQMDPSIGNMRGPGGGGRGGNRGQNQGQ